ncbi:MAG: hypothetical protein KGS72_21810 [Cyanobacteria bacterium REEB67]|nr:hypothetical protein [Cyanobacteria bacterium REEB67]
MALDASFCSKCGAKITHEPERGPKAFNKKQRNNAANRWASKNKSSNLPLVTIAMFMVGAAAMAFYNFDRERQQPKKSLAITAEQLYDRFNTNSGKTGLSMSRPENNGLNGFDATIKLGTQQQSALKLNGNFDSKNQITVLNLTQEVTAQDDVSNDADASRFLFSEITLANALDSTLQGKVLESVMRNLNPKMEHSHYVCHGIDFDLLSGGSFTEPYRWKFSITKFDDPALTNDQSLGSSPISPSPSPIETPLGLPAPGRSVSQLTPNATYAPIANPFTNRSKNFGRSKSKGIWVKHTYIRSAGADSPEGKLTVETDGIKCKFTVEAQGARGPYGVDGNGLIENGVVTYINENMPGADAGSTVILRQINATTIVLSGGQAYSEMNAPLEGTYRLADKNK